MFVRGDDTTHTTMRRGDAPSARDSFVGSTVAALHSHETARAHRACRQRAGRGVSGCVAMAKTGPATEAGTPVPEAHVMNCFTCIQLKTQELLRRSA